MPRDSNGVYSLPAGNPVVTLTPISSTWANTTLDDIGDALTDSLDRAGSGGMTGQLKLANGLIGAPGLSWSTETNSGLYRNAAGDLRYSIASNNVIQLVAGALRLVAGVVATPSLSFIADPDTGIYNGAANEINFSSGGALRFSIASTAVVSGTTHRFQDGLAATPSITFDADLDTGLYRNAANSMRFAANGADITQLSTAGAYFLPGSAGTPSISFLADTNTGLYNNAADSMRFAANGADIAQLSTAGAYFLDGSAGSPSLSFLNDTNTGVYRIGADDIGFSTGGSLRVEINSSGTLLYGGVEVGYRGMNSASNSGASFTLTNAHNGRVVSLSNAGGAVTLTLPVLAANTAIGILNNQTAGNITVSRSGTSLFSFGFGDANRTIGPLGMATLWTVDGTTWFIAGSGIS